MALNVHIAHFNVGEYSKAGMARIDLERTRLACETQENIFSHAIGKGQVRPGTEYLVGTESNNQARLIPFVRETDDVAVIVMTNGKMRVLVDDAYVTRASVSTSVTNGDFSSGTGWTITASSGSSGDINSTVSGALSMEAEARGSEVYCERTVSVAGADQNVEHAFDIDVTRGPIIFQAGSTSGGVDYIAQTTLDTGYHSLAFTPTGGTVYVRFTQRNNRQSIVNSIAVAASGTLELTAPWTTAQLRNISYDQSADVIFLANKNWRPHKIERRGTTSWSLAEYHSDDGPFRAAPGTEVQVTPGKTYGNTTLTADKAVFTSDMAGSLVRLYHDRFDATFELAGDDTFTDIFVVRGIKGTNFNDRRFDYQTSGTWSGTGRTQRSLTGPDGDFIDYMIDDGSATTTFTTNQNISHGGETEDNNLVGYMRIGFIDGAYTSGTMTVAVQYEGSSGYGVARITGYNSSTSVNIEVLEDFNADSGTKSWEIGEWSDLYGWPSAVAFFDGRLWWGGLDSFWGSASDAYYTFDDLNTTDSATIQRKVATGGQVSRVHWFLPLQRLIVGTTGAEVSIRSSSFDEPLTPTNVTLKDASTMGAADVSPVKIDSRGVFVHRSQTRVLAVHYSVESNDYVTADLTTFNQDICGDGIVELAAQREPETYVWCVRSDGQACILNYDWSTDAQILGWSRFITDGEVESVCTVPGTEQDRVYLAIKRTIDGSTVRYIEKLALHSEAQGGTTNKMADSGITTAGPATSVTAAHLANETGLVGWATDVSGNKVALTGLSANSSGVISLGDTYSNIYVGLAYTAKYKSSKLAYGARKGTALLQKRRVSQLGLLMENTHKDAVTAGRDFDNLRALPRKKDGTTIADYTVWDEYDADLFSVNSYWDTDARVCLQVSAPYPATFLGLVYSVELDER